MKHVDYERKVGTGLKTKLRPVFDEMAESFRSGTSQKKCMEILSFIKTALKASPVRSNIIEYKGYKLKIRISGNSSWRFSQVYTKEAYDYELYLRFHEDETYGGYLIKKDFFSTLKGGLSHPPCKVIKAYNMKQAERDYIIQNQII